MNGAAKTSDIGAIETAIATIRTANSRQDRVTVSIACESISDHDSGNRDQRFLARMARQIRAGRATSNAIRCRTRLGRAGTDRADGAAPALPRALAGGAGRLRQRFAHHPGYQALLGDPPAHALPDHGNVTVSADEVGGIELRAAVSATALHRQ